MLAEIAKRSLANAGVAAEHRPGMGGTIILWEALRTGQIHHAFIEDNKNYNLLKDEKTLTAFMAGIHDALSAIVADESLDKTLETLRGEYSFASLDRSVRPHQPAQGARRDRSRDYAEHEEVEESHQKGYQLSVISYQFTKFQAVGGFH